MGNNSVITKRENISMGITIERSKNSLRNYNWNIKHSENKRELYIPRYWSFLCIYSEGRTYEPGQNQICLPWKCYGKGWKINNVLTMELNCRTSLIDESQGIAYLDVMKGDDIKYQLFVSMFYQHTFIRIINFCTM